MTRHEWTQYWLKVAKGDASTATELVKLADEICDFSACTEEEYIEARESGELAKAFPTNPTAEDLEANYLAAVEAGFIDEP
jgi:hypothetical protein